MFDELYPPGLQWYWKGDFVSELSDEAIALRIRHGSEIPTLLSGMHLYPIDGAVHRVGKNDTAFSYRDVKWSTVYGGIDPANAERITGWARSYWEALHPYSAGGAYVNFMMDEGEERIRAAYRDNFERLLAIENEYDSTNLFRRPEHRAHCYRLRVPYRRLRRVREGPELVLQLGPPTFVVVRQSA